MAQERIKINTTFEVRSIGEGAEQQVHLQGYALTFDNLSEDLGGFKEIIKAGALDSCIMDNVVLNVNHDMDKVLARTNKTDGIGSLKLLVDDKGLFFDAIPTDTTYSRDLIANMQAGIIDKCSFAFTLDYDDANAQIWDWGACDGADLRTINKIYEIFDVSIVTNPAYESTSCTSYKRAKADLEKERDLEMRKRKIKLELELI